MPKEHSPQMLNWAYPQRSCNSPQVTNFNSMIFKTITSSVDETRKTLALFNKDWNAYKRNWQNANGVFGKIGSVFTPANAITKSDIEAIKAYNSQIDSCVTSQTAFNRTMLNASPAAQNLVASYNGGKVSAQGMATAQNAAKASTIGLTIAQTALNAAIGMGIGLLISLVVKGIDKLVHANEEAIEKAEELRRKYEEFKSTNESNISTLNGLKKEFEELSKGVSQYGDNVSLTTEQYERYKEIIQQIVGMSPSLAEGYSTENGYIADKNGLLERAIELQEIEYRNELRKITNLENLKTSMSGYIAEYKDALNGGFITAEGNIVGTTIDTDFKNSLWQLFNTNNRENYDGQSMAKDIMDALGVKDIDAEMQKYFNEYGYWQDSWFWNDYCDTIINNLNAVTDSLSFEEVGLDEDIFDQNLEKLESYVESYRDMKDSVEMANNAIQTDLGYIAEYADGYSKLSTEQQKFVTDFLKGFNISDITSENAMGFLEYDNDKMASVKSQIKKFVETLSQDESTKTALANLYAIPTDEQSISEFVEQFRNALEVIKAYCQENGIEIPIAITNSEQTINDLEAQYQRAVDFAKDKFDGYDPTAFFKEHSINTQEEIDAWQKIAQEARNAAEAEREYIQGSTLNKNPISSLSITDTVEQLNAQLKPAFDSLQSAWKDIFTDDGFELNSIDILSTCDSIKSKLDEMTDPEGLNLDVDYSAYEDLVSVLSNAESTEQDVEIAFDSLATSITQAALTGKEDFSTMKAALEDLGVANNEIVAFDALISNTEALKEAGLDLADATDEQIQAFANETVSAENVSQAIEMLYYQKALCNDQAMNTAGEVANLKTLAENAGYTGEVIQYLTELEQIYQEVANGTINPAVIGAKIVRAAQLQTLIQGAAAKIDYKPIEKSAAKAGSSAGKSYADALKDELSNLNNVINYIGDTIGDQIDLFEDQKDAAVDALEAEKEAAEEALEAEKELAQEKIDAKQAEIDAIEDAAKARKNELDLQKAQYDLERMQNQKTMLVNYMPDTIVI